MVESGSPPGRPRRVPSLARLPGPPGASPGSCSQRRGLRGCGSSPAAPCGGRFRSLEQRERRSVSWPRPGLPPCAAGSLPLPFRHRPCPLCCRVPPRVPGPRRGPSPARPARLKRTQRGPGGSRREWQPSRAGSARPPPAAGERSPAAAGAVIVCT